jgi:hypothetical protein
MVREVEVKTDSPDKHLSSGLDEMEGRRIVRLGDGKRGTRGRFDTTVYILLYIYYCIYTKYAYF